MKRIEALALAIAHENNALEPGSEAFEMLNPGLLRSYSIERVNPVNEVGTRQFASFQAGWQALLNNLQAKCQGRTKAKGYTGVLAGESTLHDLVRTFRFVQTRRVVEMLQDALNDRAVTELTKLSFFVEEGLNGNHGHRNSDKSNVAADCG